MITPTDKRTNTARRLPVPIPAVTAELLDEMAGRVVANFDPEMIVLFGSHAYGSPHAESDLDLLVIMESERPLVQRIIQVARVARVPLLPMDLLVFTPAEIQERLAKQDFFIQEILSKGKVLYRRGGSIC